jgi:hypothetical protein
MSTGLLARFTVTKHLKGRKTVGGRPQGSVVGRPRTRQAQGSDATETRAKNSVLEEEGEEEVNEQLQALVAPVDGEEEEQEALLVLEEKLKALAARRAVNEKKKGKAEEVVEEETKEKNVEDLTKRPPSQQCPLPSEPASAASESTVLSSSSSSSAISSSDQPRRPAAPSTDSSASRPLLSDEMAAFYANCTRVLPPSNAGEAFSTWPSLTTQATQLPSSVPTVVPTNTTPSSNTAVQQATPPSPTIAPIPHGTNEESSAQAKSMTQTSTQPDPATVPSLPVHTHVPSTRTELDGEAAFIEPRIASLSEVPDESAAVSSQEQAEDSVSHKEIITAFRNARSVMLVFDDLQKRLQKMVAAEKKQEEKNEQHEKQRGTRRSQDKGPPATTEATKQQERLKKRAETNTLLFEDLRDLKARQEDLITVATGLARTLICPGTRFKHNGADYVVVARHDDEKDVWKCTDANGNKRSAKTIMFTASDIVA